MQPKTQCIPGSAGDVIDSLLFIGLQGVYGPYGGDGGEDFASERPGKCFTEIIIVLTREFSIYIVLCDLEPV